MARAYPYDATTQALNRPAAAPAFFDNQMAGDDQAVPLRDLADHAPINDVSGLTGRRP